ncbi:hypothetical protein SAMN05660772_02306 [Pasteurella testudinis DSM 23072]|uniref:Transferrin-binding protein B C-lobe/N-lobe beta barrel domain-containing protein n=1 Tax=Pasteurella testudinis DSM 23072 TaxID=1122938 RepID=A0A1W1UUQ6_9PAST|nr:hypothetical protein [Pasteurella testudinis]SMB84551.1 hypothetical protein SAMN05660772_02306 [Pasteurella testudinis DSM 23072]SUB52943.1 Uncharacterised protein [Pasteurella testudinis]
MMKNIYNKTAIALFLSVLLAACSGGGGSSGSTPTSVAANIVAQPTEKNKENSTANSALLAELKEKEALQKAADNKQSGGDTLSENNGVNQPQPEVVADKDKQNDQPDVTPPKNNNEDIKSYGGVLTSTYSERNDNAWNDAVGIKPEYKITFNKDSGTVTTLFVQDKNGQETILPLGKIGYYGNLTFTSDVINPQSVTGEKMKAQITDFVYYGEKDNKNPDASMNYEGKVFYSVEMEAAKQANLDLTYNAADKKIAGRIIGGELNMEVKSEVLSDGIIQAKATPTTGHQNPEIGAANLDGAFLGDGKYIAGTIKSSDTTDSTRAWGGVFGAEGTPRP